ncbi:GIP [Symbiodinium sp. KB8]|nr:GIP [Symbiodinium sp. KB8]
MASRFEELSVFDLEGLDFPTDRRRIAVDALLQSSAVRENRKAPNIVAADDSSVAKLKARAARQKVREAARAMKDHGPHISKTAVDDAVDSFLQKMRQQGELAPPIVRMSASAHLVADQAVTLELTHGWRGFVTKVMASGCGLSIDSMLIDEMLGKICTVDMGEVAMIPVAMSSKLKTASQYVLPRPCLVLPPPMEAAQCAEGLAGQIRSLIEAELAERVAQLDRRERALAEREELLKQREQAVAAAEAPTPARSLFQVQAEAPRAGGRVIPEAWKDRVEQKATPSTASKPLGEGMRQPRHSAPCVRPSESVAEPEKSASKEPAEISAVSAGTANELKDLFEQKAQQAQTPEQKRSWKAVQNRLDLPNAEGTGLFRAHEAPFRRGVKTVGLGQPRERRSLQELLKADELSQMAR